MLIEFDHVFMTRFGRPCWRWLLDYIGFPFVVAMIITQAFLMREYPQDHIEGFLFFSTLYAFWCGLFSSCQIFNGESESGEWSCWVLTLRRSRFKHLTAQTTASIVGAMMQVLFCLLWFVPIALVFQLGTGNELYEKFNAAYLANGVYGFQEFKSAFGQVKFWDWTVFFANYYFLGMVVACISGVFVGLLISSIVRDCAIALTVSVCVVVLSAILSHTTLQGKENSERRIHPFEPVYLNVRAKCFSVSDLSDARPLVLLSYLSPQRYFYNIARVPVMKFKSEWREVETIQEHSSKPPKKTGTCLCLACCGLIKIVTNGDGERFVEDSILHKTAYVPIEKHWVGLESGGAWKQLLKQHPECIVDVRGANIWEQNGIVRCVRHHNIANIQSLYLLMSRMAVCEIAVLGLMCVVLCGMTFWRLCTGRIFNEVR